MRCEKIEPGGVQFRCPGCEQTHVVWVEGATQGPKWEWNGSLDRPTFSPSILVRSGHYAPGQPPGRLCWCTYEARYGKPAPFKCVVCHSFVTEGRIQFLGDCTHALAGQTVLLPEFREDDDEPDE
jgi:hypothetical protein